MGTAERRVSNPPLLGPPKGGAGVRKCSAKSIGGMGFLQRLLPRPPTNEAGLRAPGRRPYSEEPIPKTNGASPARSMKEGCLMILAGHFLTPAPTPQR